MGFFRKLLGKEKIADPVLDSSPPAGPAHGVAYDPKLIDGLLHTHAQLGTVFAQIGEAHQNDEYERVRALLEKFRTMLQAHILVENVRFYSYLEQSLSGQPDDKHTMHEFRTDMNRIAKAVVEFTKKYQVNAFSTVERTQFGDDYKTVGQLLEQRLDNEESSLYPLYAPK